MKSDPDYPVDEHGEELEHCWDCDRQIVNEANAVGQVDEGDYDPFICAECGKKPENAEHLWRCPECDVPEGDGSCSECLTQQREEGRYEELWDE